MGIEILYEWVRRLNDFVSGWSGLLLLVLSLVVIVLVWRSRRYKKLLELLELYLEAFTAARSGEES